MSRIGLITSAASGPGREIARAALALGTDLWTEASRTDDRGASFIVANPNTLESGSDAAFLVAEARWRTHPLDRVEEARLATRWRLFGDKDAADALARALQRHVVAQALRYRRYGLPVGELIAEGNLGVVYALRKFDPERGIRFVTYASYWVRAQMLALVVRSFGGMVNRGGALRSRVFFKLRRERARIANQMGEGGDAELKLAERMGVSADQLRGMLRTLDERDIPLDHPVGAGKSPAEYLSAPDDQEHSLAHKQIDGRMHDLVSVALATLDARELFIAESRLMAPASEELSLADIGRRLDVSRERARQLEARAKQKLRRAILSTQDPVVNDWLAITG